MGLILNIMALVISAGALAVSIYVLHRSRPLQKLQERVAELDLEERLEARFTRRRADIRAEVDLDAGSIVIRNVGRGTAQTVDIHFLDKADPIVPSERAEKLPIEVLRPGESCLLVAGMVMGRAPPFKVALTWQDSNNRPQSYEQELYRS